MRAVSIIAFLVASSASAQPYRSTPKLPGPPSAYWTQHAAKKAETIQPSVVFLGDSITNRWETDGTAVWAEHFGGPDANDPNRPLGWTAGGSGDMTQHLIFRIGDHVLDNKGSPGWVFILIGTNNLPANYGNNPAWELNHGVLEVVRATRRRMPNSSIWVISILPRGDGYAGVRTQANQYLSEALPTECGARFLDVESSFYGDGGLLPGLYQPDGLHLTEAGYSVLAEKIIMAMNTP